MTIKREVIMKILSQVTLYCSLLMCVIVIKGNTIPPFIINDIETSDMTPALEIYASNPSNISATDSNGNSMLMLAVQSSLFYFFLQLFNTNPTGFATLVNQPNNFGITPLQASYSNPYGKINIIRMIQFLLRNGAH